MTDNFEKLVQVALLGTERQAPPRPSGEALLEKLQQQVTAAAPEQSLLSMAALAGAHERAGSLPARELNFAESRAPTENAQRVTEAASNALQRLLRSEFREVSEDLLLEWLRLAAAQNKIALPESLPLLLSFASLKRDLREFVSPILGKRGHWLGQQNQEWSWAISTDSGDPAIWETGGAAERLAYLRALRASNPSKARELLASTWKEESPEDRASFLETLQTSLSASDEPFLESCLADKRKDVRTVAANLLVRIPSKFLANLITRALSILTFVPGQEGSLVKLRKAKGPSIEIKYSAIDEASAKLPFSSKAPKGIGEKTWILIQLLEAVPLEIWTSNWKLSPLGIVQASIASEGILDLLEGWVRAAARQKNAEWAEAVFPAALEADKTDRLAELLSVMRQESAEKHLSELLESKAEKVSALKPSLLAEARRSWSPQFSRNVFAWLRNITAEESYNWQLRNNLIQYIPRLAPEVLPQTKSGWPVESKGWDFWRSGVDDFITVAQFRDEMIHSLSDQI